MPNTSLTRDFGRQSPLYAVIEITAAQLVDTAVAVKAINLPYGAIVVGGFVVVDTAFDTSTSAVLALGDLTVTNRYASGVNLKAAAVTQLSITGYQSDGEEVYALPTLVGTAATVGKLRIVLSYIIKNRASEVQPN